MASDKIGIIELNQIRCMDWFRPEPKMWNSYRSRFFRIIDKITLRIVICIFTNYFDCILVGSHSPISAKTKAYAANRFIRLYRKTIVVIQAGIADIIPNANCEVVFGMFLLEFFKNPFYHRRCKFFPCQTVPSPKNNWLLINFWRAILRGFHNRRTHV